MKSSKLPVRTLSAMSIAVCLLALHQAAAAGMHNGDHVHAADGASQPAETVANHTSSAGLTDGEVRKVDKENGKVTLRHGPIGNLDMPGMTMVFRIVDKGALDTLKAGDKVKFRAESDNGQLTVTEIQSAN